MAESKCVVYLISACIFSFPHCAALFRMLLGGNFCSECVSQRAGHHKSVVNLQISEATVMAEMAEKNVSRGRLKLPADKSHPKTKVSLEWISDTNGH